MTAHMCIKAVAVDSVLGSNAVDYLTLLPPHPCEESMHGVVENRYFKKR